MTENPTPAPNYAARKLVLWLLLIVGVAGVVNCVGGGDGDSDRRELTYRSEFGGEQSVYDRISIMTDCSELQDQFNIAAANNETSEPETDEHRWTLGYMTAADDRMETVGCYD